MIALVAWGCGAAGAEPAGEPPEPSFVRVTEAQGLSHGNVRAIAQDRQGFIWLGTVMGLNRFDGYQITTFMRDNDRPASIVGNLVWALLVDRGGALWVGTDSGLDRYDAATETFVHVPLAAGGAPGLPHPSVLALHEDQQGILWVGSRGGLTRMDRAAGTFTTYTREPVVPGSPNANSIRFITEDERSGLLWLGTSDGVAAFDPRSGRFASFVHDNADPESLCHNGVNRILIGDDRVFWVLTDGGLDWFTPTFDRVPDDPGAVPRQVFHHLRQDPADPTSLFGTYLRGGGIDRAGRLWVTSDKGLNLIDRGTQRVTRYRHVPDDPNSLSADFTYAFFEDRAGGLWVSTTSAGVCRLRGPEKPFRVVRRRADEEGLLPDDRVRAVAVDPAGTLWLGTYLGLYSNGEHGWRRHPGRGPEPVGDIVAVEAGPGGEVWVGTRDRGLNRYDGREYVSFASPAGNLPGLGRELPYTGHETNDLLFDREGRLWIGARAYGVDCYEGGRFRHLAPYTPAAGGAGERRRPTAFATLGGLDEAGRMWFASDGDGLVQYAQERDEFRVFLPNPADPAAPENRNFYVLADDRSGGFWLGTGGGLFRFDRASERFTHRFTAADGLPGSVVVACELDDQGRLWLGTPVGISCLDPATGRIRNYDKADGLPAKGPNLRASARGADGRIYFGTDEGLVEFAPTAIRDNPVPPPVVLTDFRLFDQPVVPGGNGSPLREAIGVTREIRLRPAQRAFSIGFAALDYSAPAKNAYRYCMEGADSGWRNASAQERRATYMNLPAGTYTFRVEASNRDGVWNREGVSVRVVVEPSWWETWWFRLGAVLAGVGAVFAGIWWRERTIRQRNDQLQREVAERTAALAASIQELEAFSYSVSHDLRAPLRNISGFVELLHKQLPGILSPNQAHYLDLVSAEAIRLGHLIDSLLAFSRLGRAELRRGRCDLGRIVAAVREELETAVGSRVVEWRLGPLPVVEGDETLLRQVFANLLGNAVKFTRERQSAVIEVGELSGGDAAEVVVFVRDNGAGFNPEYSAKLFGVFQRLHRTTEFEGTGIGLANVRRIVMRHHGRVWAEGKPGEGAVFYVALPRRADG